MTTWLITGCSAGLGESLALAVLDAGFNAVVTARDVRTVQDLVSSHADTAVGTALDVTDKTQVENAVKLAEERFGSVDVLVNNAGYGYRAVVRIVADELDAQRQEIDRWKDVSASTDFPVDA